MKISRKQLNHILVNLPHPSHAMVGKIPPVFKVAVSEPCYEIREALLPSFHETKFKELTFVYDKNEMDWVLNDLEL
jgi:hypothetical protein